MLFQAGRTVTSRAVRRLLVGGGFVGVISPAVVRYPLSGATLGGLLDVPRPAVSSFDNALPPGLLERLQAAFCAVSPFWTEHGYACGRDASPFFSCA